MMANDDYDNAQTDKAMLTYLARGIQALELMAAEACAHSTVRYVPEVTADGLRAARWLCTSGCGQRFIPLPGVEPQPVPAEPLGRFGEDAEDDWLSLAILAVGRQESQPEPLDLEAIEDNHDGWHDEPGWCTDDCLIRRLCAEVRRLRERVAAHPHEVAIEVRNLHGLQQRYDALWEELAVLRPIARAVARAVERGNPNGSDFSSYILSPYIINQARTWRSREVTP